MTFTLLLDLDDTLLDTNLDAFLPAYFNKLALHMANKIGPDVFIKALIKSTQVMYANTNAGKTLEQVFGSIFYTMLGYSETALEKEIDLFYDDIFPNLGTLTKPRPEAIKFVDWAFSKGWNVAIATDPLFPRKAILHRLRWAGLAPEKYPFILISDFHGFHFVKLSVAFYPEFLTKMGWEYGSVLMVGDSLERDIIPANKAGLPTYWLNGQPGILGSDFPVGDFNDLVAYLESTDLSVLQVDYTKFDSLYSVIQSTPATIHSLLIPVIYGRIFEKVHELEGLLIPLIHQIIELDLTINFSCLELFFDKESSSALWSDIEQSDANFQTKSLDEVFQWFVDVRAKLLSILTGYSQVDINKKFHNKETGPRSLFDFLNGMVLSDREFIKKIKIIFETLQ